MSYHDYRAVVRADSVDGLGEHRLTTIEVTFPRYVLAEMNTHRTFSRNSASSRAIPVGKRIEAVDAHPFVPPFGKNKPGMQAEGELDGDLANAAIDTWLTAKDMAVAQAKRLADLEVHKQVANRLLEPFAWHTAIISSTEWENFLNQRDPRRTSLADPAISPAALAIGKALESSTPRVLGSREWHLPYIDDSDRAEVTSSMDLCRISAARCARVSYETHEGTRDHAKDIELFDRLATASPPHASPLEHVATPCSCDTYVARKRPATGMILHDVGPHRVVQPDHLGNFTGWDQLRHRVFGHR